jgi:hypothetical protein
MNIFRLLVICIFLSFNGIAQKVTPNNDSIGALNSQPKTTIVHSPRTATIMSAACPGLGQVYNKNYWKVPVIYAGFAALGYGLVYTNSYYQTFKDAYDVYRKPYLDSGVAVPTNATLTLYNKLFTIPNVQANRDYYRRYRDLCIIGMGSWYLLNILEAYVAANMFDFDTSDDLTFRIEPMFYSSQYTPTGIKLSLRF